MAECLTTRTALYKKGYSMPKKHLAGQEIMLAAAYRHGNCSPLRDETGRLVTEAELQRYDAHALDCSACNEKVEKQLAQITSSLNDLAAGKFTTRRVVRRSP